jgi:iron complex outermembrane receptor protein
VADEAASFSNWTWRAALDWDVTKQNFLYASVATGFKSGGFFFSSDSQMFDPEHLTAYTLGSKNRFLDDRLQLDLEVFHWRYDDQQISMISLDSRGVPNLRTRNVGNSTMNGIEVEMQWLATDATRLFADAQYVNAIYDDFRYIVPITAPPVSGCTVLGEADGYHVDCSDKRAPYAPKWTVNVGADHTFQLRNDARLVADARGHYQSETLTGLDFTPLEYHDSYMTLGASVTYNSRDDKYYVAAFGNNLTDESVLASTFQPPFGAFVVGTLRLPRLYGLRLGMRF